jgi:hypothetical protein
MHFEAVKYKVTQQLPDDERSSVDISLAHHFTVQDTLKAPRFFRVQ